MHHGSEYLPHRGHALAHCAFHLELFAFEVVGFRVGVEVCGVDGRDEDLVEGVFLVL